MATNFKDEDVKAGKEAVRHWIKHNADAALSLYNIWKAHYMLVGHKNLAREILKFFEVNPLKEDVE